MFSVKNKGYLNFFLEADLDAEFVRKVDFITLFLSAEYSKMDPQKRHTKMDIFPFSKITMKYLQVSEISQNHRMVEAGRHLWRSSGTNPCSSRST